MTTKIKIASLAVAASMIAGGLFTTQSFAQGAGPNGGVQAGAKLGQGKGGEKREKHPEIMKAIKNLEQAKTNLNKADRDFGGHRTKAVDAVNIALSECREALKYDKN